MQAYHELFTMELPQYCVAACVDRTNREPSVVAVMQVDRVVEEIGWEERVVHTRDLHFP